LGPIFRSRYPRKYCGCGDHESAIIALIFIILLPFVF